MTQTRLSGIESLLEHPVVQAIQAEADRQQCRVLLVGGGIRDFLLSGEMPVDLDFTVLDGDVRKLAKTMADRYHGHLVALDWEFGIHRVVLPNEALTLDFSEALENDLEIDLARRDLTINALAVDLKTGELLDRFNGQADLASRTVRMIRETNLLDDPLRMLRVFRFAARLQGAIDPETLKTVSSYKGRIQASAAERIQYEFFKMLDAERCFPALRIMAECGLLEVLIPEMTPMRGIQSSGYHHLGLFDHTLELVRQAERLISECPEKTRAWLRSPLTPYYSRFAILKLACLLHDVGKPDTMGCKTLESGQEKLTFYGHEMVGEDMSDIILRRLKTSNEIRGYVKKLVRWHLYPCQFGPDSPRRSVMRFFRRMGDETPDVVLLALADRHSTLGTHLTPEDLRRSHEAHVWLLEQYNLEEKVLKQPPLLNGHQMMQLLDVGPGPHLKEMIEALAEAQQMGEVTTSEQAEAWLKAHYSTLS